MTIKSLAAACETVTKQIYFIYSSELRISRLKQDDIEIVPKRISEYSGISREEINNCVSKLADAGFIILREKGIVLTGKGKERGAWLMRRHRLIEVLLIRLCDTPLSKVYELAELLEGGFDEILTEKIRVLLRNPLACPHGEVIP